jgi:hypothetical protein
MLWKVLSGRLKLDYDKTTDILVRTYLLEDLDIDAQPWLDDEIDNGVPEEEWGLLCREGWHMDGLRMDPAVDMVITEGIRRGLNVQQHLLDFVLYGFVDEKTGKNVPMPRQLRRDRSVVLPSEGWPGKREKEKAIMGLDERFGIRRLRMEDRMDMDTN